jgi:CheY-like chemotaxis protein
LTNKPAPAPETNTEHLDLYLGRKLKEFRQRVNWTLNDLGGRVGLSHQQIHKYEQAQSKISASMLYHFADVFNTSPVSFFEGYEPLNSNNQVDRKDLITGNKKQFINLLLVEDNPGDEYLVRKAVSKSHNIFNIYQMHSGEDLLDFLKNRQLHPFPRPDIILLDLHLPGINGHDVLRAIKQDRDMQEIPVLVLTNSLNKMDLIKAYKNFASGYISKSFEYELFENSLLKALDYWVEAVILPTSD